LSNIHIDCALILMDVRAELSRLNLWQGTLPSPQALASTEPFCVDTLDFNQWVQFVFLPRMQDMIERQAALPERCGIAPMAEEFVRVRRLDGRALVSSFEQLDYLLSGQHPAV
jgi:uncharacterized protein YqcC (DUF446 family)